ncbi:hypothetical protein NJB1907E19_37150 [Mycobacterium marinum]|nr:hypothetical protein [Mycobacterium marinum]GJO06029.1 hypothetical protein NJB1907E90_16720 [Mycobacterium marinum]GJO14475.1 hypothetical protein NJB1907f34b_50940 [Mycobacterium marinum]GJO44679.1 hypothetical protein NJB1907E19_37150 [Mycobacterium marinum]GJO93802.1 hypothetical protein NJB1728910S_39720 [Mycobacterium marinum]
MLSLNSAGVEVDPPIPLYAAIPAGGPPEVRYRDPLHAHLQDAGAVEQSTALPAAWVSVRDRWAQLVSLAAPCRNDLTAAVLTGDGDLAELHALALAETAPNTETEAEVRRHVGAAVHHELTRLYQPAAAKVYSTIRKLFDDAAGQRDEPQLDQLLPVLLAAARLCGADRDVAAYATARIGIALTVDPRKAHKRRLTEAFAGPNRWQRIRELGASVRANPDPLAPPWQLPDPFRCVDTNRSVRWHDPLDGPLPDGWQGPVDGWLGKSPSFGQL